MSISRLPWFVPLVALLFGCWAGLAPSAVQAQLLAAPEPESALSYGEPRTYRFQVGAEVTASRGACRGIQAMVAVPLECPNQTVQVVNEEFSREVERVSYRDLNGARQMLISIPQLAAGERAQAVVTFEVTTKPILPPDEETVAQYKIPEKPERSLRQYLMASPYIETRDRQIRNLAHELWDKAAETDDDQPVSDWQRIESLYDYMLENIKYVEGPDTSAVTTLRDGKADCHGRSALFIALCRANKVPARVVWVNNHAYAEFYLEEEEGKGTWFPIESAGSRAFGSMPLARAILQKGDNFRVPERPRDRLRYASDFLVGVPVPGAGQPNVRYIRKELD